MINKYIETFKIFKSEIFISLYETLDMLSVAMLLTLILGILLGFILFTSRTDGILENKII